MMLQRLLFYSQSFALLQYFVLKAILAEARESGLRNLQTALKARKYQIRLAPSALPRELTVQIMRKPLQLN